ncbi:hypothetical protein [Cohnella sp. GCM10027633]|uniref:hypothetical protein n=1 Tax=unclassified Cohnella TaxID=2636738 RepID=UPI003645402E
MNAVEWMKVEKEKAAKMKATTYDSTVPKEESKEEKTSQAKLLVQMAKPAQLFHTPDDDFYARVPVNGHYETWPIRSKAFCSWLTRTFYHSTEKPPGNQAMSDALRVLEAIAQFEGQKLPVFTRIAKLNDTIYLDLCNEKWQVVEITISGWKIVNDSPVRFRRAKGMSALPTPSSEGTVDELRPFINFETEEDFRLIVAWMIAAFQPESPYPVLTLQGEQGSAKSTTSRVIKSLIDPSTAPLRTFPKDERDLAIAATNAHILTYDNLSGISNQMSDAVCKLATGGGLATRKLHTDDEEAIFNVRRPVIINGIDDIATRQDLVSRSILVNLPSIPEEKRSDESTFWESFELRKPSILGALLTAVSGAMRELPKTKLMKKPRMADFALWATAAEEALGWQKGDFMKAYGDNIISAVSQGLEADPVAAAVRLMMAERKDWVGTPRDLLAALNHYADDSTRKSRSWPSDRKISGRLKRVSSALRSKGINYYDLGHSERGRKLRLERVESTSSVPSESSESVTIQGFGTDDILTITMMDVDNYRQTDDVQNVSSGDKPSRIKEYDDPDDAEDSFETSSSDESILI